MKERNPHHNYDEKHERMQTQENEAANFESTDKHDWTALHYACLHGRLQMVRILIEHARVDIDRVNSSNNTALHIAAKNGHLEICKYLVEEAQPRKADVLHPGLDNETPMECAKDLGKFEVANYLSVHQKRMQHWKNRNCLLKIMINRKKTDVFRNVPECLFKEIMKYA